MLKKEITFNRLKESRQKLICKKLKTTEQNIHEPSKPLQNLCVLFQRAPVSKILTLTLEALRQTLQESY